MLVIIILLYGTVLNWSGWSNLSLETITDFSSTPKLKTFYAVFPVEKIEIDKFLTYSFIFNILYLKFLEWSRIRILLQKRLLIIKASLRSQLKVSWSWSQKVMWKSLWKGKPSEIIITDFLQGRHLPEGLCGCRGGSCLRWPCHWICHPAGESPLPCCRGGKGQGPLWKQGESLIWVSLFWLRTVIDVWMKLVHCVFSLHQVSSERWVKMLMFYPLHITVFSL